ncbi:hypothetical protein [Leptospira mayottensis]|uniref:Uncharacterized protein n=2 Tax=Leptospira mayottensis TaxID=1137606 RepID=A0AA87SXX4_9LEPT|nr:hypothetical protein [Leptospira mayottensis]AXR59369.1 hypothetical protein DQM68_00100 [Leptospira mayottensis]AXR63155.1 hypothetical protein DQM28_01785 [Leptospira mayottensis]AZQ01318.1 hypothetical protein LEP1GSC190_03900 [Leptospira mayottensis 200901116]EKS01684.1 hypothetical protein LEP1GSC125_0086 [Leptospira mayottensis 200901122]TGM89019.1 hypothetical protein EHR03_19565 [Leptospira mayottensis]
MKEYIQKTIKLENGDRVILYDSDKIKGKIPVFEFNRNVIKVDKNDVILWRIKVPGKDDWEAPFLKIKLRQGKLIAYHWAGGEFEVNLEDGSIKLIQEHR